MSQNEAENGGGDCIGNLESHHFLHLISFLLLIFFPITILFFLTSDLLSVCFLLLPLLTLLCSLSARFLLSPVRFMLSL
jgi:hypothetical protein